MNLLKNMYRLLINNSLLIIVILFALIVGFYFPGTYWAFVDDGEMIQVSERMKSSLYLIPQFKISEWWADPQMGRYRPFYWLYHFLVYFIFGVNHTAHGVVQVGLMIGIVIAGYFTAYCITGKKLAGFIVGLLLTFNTLNQENWYRLGPQEAPMTFFIALAIMYMFLYIKQLSSQIGPYIDVKNFKLNFETKVSKLSLIKPNFVLSVIFTIPIYFMKENSVAFLSFSLVLLIWSFLLKSRRIIEFRGNLVFYFIFNIILAGFVRFMAFKGYSDGTYASDYLLAVPNILSNLRYYIFTIWITFEPVIILAALFALTKIANSVYRLKVDQILIFIFCLSTVFLSFFVIQLPWRYAIPRYLLPSMYIFMLLTGTLLHQLLINVNEKSTVKIFKEFGIVWVIKAADILIWTFIIVTLAYNIIMMSQYISRVVNLTINFNKPLIAYLEENVINDGTVFLDTPPGTALELRQEIGLHLSIFAGRKDVKVEYFSDVGAFKTGDVLLRAGELKQVSNDIEVKKFVQNKPNRIDIHLESRLYYPPMQFMKDYMRTYISKNTNGQKTGFYPVLSESQDNYYWELYKLTNTK